MGDDTREQLIQPSQQLQHKDVVVDSPLKTIPEALPIIKVDESGTPREVLESLVNPSPDVSDKQTKEIKIPEIKFSPMARLDRFEGVKGEKILQNQWRLFWEIRQKGQLPREAYNDFIAKGALLHNMIFDTEAINTIMESGIVSGEIGYGDKRLIEEDTETNFCADFFRNTSSDKSIKQYCEEAVTPQSEIISSVIMRRFLS